MRLSSAEASVPAGFDFLGLYRTSHRGEHCHNSIIARANCSSSQLEFWER